MLSVAFVAAWVWLVLGQVCLPAAHAQTARPNVVIFVPERLPAETRSALEDALATQLSLLHARAFYAGPAARTGDPVERVENARRIATRYAAIAIFWLEVPNVGPWVLYAADAGITQVMARRLGHLPKTSVEANIETVAVIVRATADALLHGEPMPSEDAAEESRATAPWPVEQIGGSSAAFRLSGAYLGTTFAKEAKWQQGVALRLAWIWGSGGNGGYVGGGFTFLERMRFDIPPGSFEIDRYPISLHAGLRFSGGRFTYIGELGAELELRKRRSTSTASDTLEPLSSGRDKVFNICPKLETELAVLDWLRLFAGVGLDFVVGNFPYSIRHERTGETTVKLEPYLIRLNVQVGIALLR